MNEKNKTVVVLGASQKRERYSNKAIRLLKDHGYRVIPIHPIQNEIEGLDVIHDLGLIDEHVDTLTIYVGHERIHPMISQIIQIKPGRVILNPGTESPELEEVFNQHEIPFVKGCTLVMLQTDQF